MENISNIPIGFIKIKLMYDGIIKYITGSNLFFKPLLPLDAKAIKYGDIEQTLSKLAGESLLSKYKEKILVAARDNKTFSEDISVSISGKKQELSTVRIASVIEDRQVFVYLLALDSSSEVGINDLVTTLCDIHLINSISKDVQFKYNVLKDILYMPYMKPDGKLGYTEINDYKSANYINYVHPEYREAFSEILDGTWAGVRNDKGCFEYRGKFINSKCYTWIKFNFIYIRNENKDIVSIIGRLSDIQAEKRAQRKLEMKLRTDSATGLLNKVATETITTEIFKGLSKSDDKFDYYILVIDVDNFKFINDSYGHYLGDRAIKIVSKILKKHFRNTDVIGRIGGDEFFILLKNISKEMVEKKCYDMLKNLKEEEFAMSLSIGISKYGKDGRDYITLFSKADIAMYQAKVSNKGKKVVFYDSTYNENSLHEKKENLKIKKQDNILLIANNEKCIDDIKLAISKDFNFIVCRTLNEWLMKYNKTKDKINLIIIDDEPFIMSKMEELSSLIKEIKSSEVPIMMLVEDINNVKEETIYSLGADDVILKPVLPKTCLNRVKGIIELHNIRKHLKEAELKSEENLRKQYKKIESSQFEILLKMNTLIEFRDFDNNNQHHCEKICEYVKILLEELSYTYPNMYGYNEEQIRIISKAAMLHDIGKITIPEYVLLKNDEFSEQERKMMRNHTVKGGQIIEHILEDKGSLYYNTCMHIALYHHEKYDGSGYPFGLKNNQIPIEAQITGLADTYDKLTSGRAYKKKISHNEAVEKILSQKTKYSKECLLCFENISDVFQDIKNKFI